MSLLTWIKGIYPGCLRNFSPQKTFSLTLACTYILPFMFCFLIIGHKLHSFKGRRTLVLAWLSWQLSPWPNVFHPTELQVWWHLAEWKWSCSGLCLHCRFSPKWERFVWCNLLKPTPPVPCSSWFPVTEFAAVGLLWQGSRPSVKHGLKTCASHKSSVVQEPQNNCFFFSLYKYIKLVLSFQGIILSIAKNTNQCTTFWQIYLSKIVYMWNVSYWLSQIII